MPICPLLDRWNPECTNARCERFTTGYVYGLLDARIDDIFYVGSTVRKPGERYSEHIGGRRSYNFREAWILAILADGSLPVLLSLGAFETACEQQLQVIEREIAEELRSMGHTAMCDCKWPRLDSRVGVEQAITEHLDRVNERARVMRWLREL